MAIFEHPYWTMPMHVINRPCGHSYAVTCECVRHPVHFATTTNRLLYIPAPEPEYVGRHRKAD